MISDSTTLGSNFKRCSPNVFAIIRTSNARPSTLPTTKVDFLTIKVVLRITRTITVFRNATDDFQTENERLAYGSRPYMQFPVFGVGAVGGGGGMGVREVRFQTAVSRKRLKITLSIWYSFSTKSGTRYRLKVVWKLYEDV